MLITESKIRQIIAEELETLLEEERLDEGWRDYIPSRRNLAALGLGAVTALGGVGAHKAGEMSATPGFGGRSAESGITSYLPGGEEDADMGGGKRVKPHKTTNADTRQSNIKKTDTKSSAVTSNRPSEKLILKSIDNGTYPVSSKVEDSIKQLYKLFSPNKEEEKAIITSLRHTQNDRYANDASERDNQFFHSLENELGGDNIKFRVAKEYFDKIKYKK